MGKSTPLAKLRLTGLVAATFTPFRPDGSLDAPRIRSVVNRVIAQEANGLYVCGSTGEGPLLSTSEREIVAAQSVEAAAGRVPVIVQVGHNSIAEARGLAAHAQRIGADGISATPPGYFRPESLPSLVECMAEIASGAPKLPFYYYHIPVLTGVRHDMVGFLAAGRERIPSLRGIKFSDAQLHEMLACIEFDGGRFDIVFGIDEMLLAGLAFGARGAVGSTYNFAAPLYRRIITAFDAGDWQEARRLQSQAARMVRTILTRGGRGGLKATMNFIGAGCGPSRRPTQTPAEAITEKIRSELGSLGIFDPRPRIRKDQPRRVPER